MEDTAALVGLVLALIGVGLAVLTDNGRWDGWGRSRSGSCCSSSQSSSARRPNRCWWGGRPTQHRGDIRAALEGDDSVRRVIHLRTLHISPDEVLVAAKIAVDRDVTAADIARTIDAAERRVRAVAPDRHADLSGAGHRPWGGP